MNLALSGMSEEYELADTASYLEVEPELWFKWSGKERSDYICKFNELTISDVMKKKTITVNRQHAQEEALEWKEYKIPTFY